MCLIKLINCRWFVGTTLVILLFAMIFDNTDCLRANYSYTNPEHGHFKLPEFNRFYNKNKGLRSYENPIQDLEQKSSGSGRDLGLIILGYAAKFCLYAYSYFKLICICMFVSLLFLLLCPLLPFLIPALLLILLVAVALSITIPIAAVAGTGGGGGGDGGVTVISSGGGGPPNFVSIPA